MVKKYGRLTRQLPHVRVRFLWDVPWGALRYVQLNTLRGERTKRCTTESIGDPCNELWRH